MDPTIMDSTELERRARMLLVSRYTLNANFSQLLAADEYELPFRSLDNEPEVRKFQMEYSRRLHNYTSSYYSLYAHTQTISNHIGDEEFDRDYRNKIDELGIEEDSDFVKRFRAYIQHYQLVPITITTDQPFLEEEEEEGSYELYIPKEKLLKWDCWRNSEDYVRNLGEKIEVMPLFDDLNDSINEYDDWFVGELRDRFGVRSDLLDDYIDLLNVDEPYPI